MRRLGLAAIAAAAVVAVVLTGRGGSDRYRVAAIFDTARGLVPGQQVKVAGAVVGTISAVRLAPGPSAEIVMRVDRRFAPFGADASCRILPEGLISENYVDCDPGDARRATLARVRGLPTVPLAQTAVPTSLQDLIDVFSLPTDQRLRVILTELGIATAGRGADLNALLRRANPALEQARRTLGVIDRQRAQLADGVAQTSRVLRVLDTRAGDVRRFVDRSATVVRTTADRRAALAAMVQRLPALLTATRGGLRSLDRAMSESTPLLGRLQAAGPQVTALTDAIPRFTAAGGPALRGLTSAAQSGLAALPAARPVVARLRTATARARPFASDFARLLASTRDTGGFEGTLRLLYGIATSYSAYDDISHMVGLAVTVLPQCMTDPTTSGCTAKYDAPGTGQRPANDPSCAVQAGEPWAAPTSCTGLQSIGVPTPRRARGHRRGRPPAPQPAAPAATPTPRPQRVPLPRPSLPLPQLPRVPPIQQAANDLLDFLLKP